MSNEKKSVPECESCTNSSKCKAIWKAGGYRYWGCLLHYTNGRQTNKSSALLRELVKAAQEFLPDSRFFRDGWLYTCGRPYGTYVWHFAVRMKQYKIWDLREFREGHAFGLDPKKPYRDANPYIEPERNHSWDCGYILGLHESKKKGE